MGPTGAAINSGICMAFNMQMGVESAWHLPCRFREIWPQMGKKSAWHLPCTLKRELLRGGRCISGLSGRARVVWPGGAGSGDGPMMLDALVQEPARRRAAGTIGFSRIRLGGMDPISLPSDAARGDVRALRRHSSRVTLFESGGDCEGPPPRSLLVRGGGSPRLLGGLLGLVLRMRERRRPRP